MQNRGQNAVECPHLVNCFQAGQEKIAGSLAVLSPHALDVDAGTGEPSIDHRASLSRSSNKDRPVPILHARSLLLASMLALAVAACGGGGAGSAPDPALNQDATPPSIPAELTATAGTAAINLAWSASTDNVGVTGYIVKRDGIQVGTTSSLTYTDSGLSSATTYGYTVAASDASGNVSPESATVSATTGHAVDTTPPSTPAGLVAAAAGGSVISLAWSASTDNVGVTGYIVKRNGIQVATPITTTSYADTGLSSATTYSYTVAARDAAGNISSNSASAIATIPDTTAPSTPTGVTAAAAGATAINLSWNPSTDNVGVTGYIVKRNGVQVGPPTTTTSYADTGLSSATTDSYTVAAGDGAGNVSSESAVV